MPIYDLPTNPDGSLIAFTQSQINAMDIRRRGVADGSHVRYNFGPDGSGCTRKFSCDWTQVFNTLLYFVGACSQWTPSGGTPFGANAISRMLPMVDPNWPSWVCTKVEFEPYQFEGTIDAQVAGTEPYPEFDRADFTAVFELVPYSLETDSFIVTNGYNEQLRYVTQPGFPGAEVNADANYIGLPGSVLRYATTDGTTGTGPAGTFVPYPAGFVEGSGKFKVIWRRVPQGYWGPSAPLTQMVLGTEMTQGYIGALNLNAFNDYPPLTLQLLGVEQRLLPDPAGLGYSWDLGYLFAHAPKPYGHLGYYFHAVSAGAGPSGYYQVLRPAAGTTTLTPTALAANPIASLFTVRDFARLFSVSA